MVVDVVSVISWLSGETGIYIEVPHACCKSILNVFPINPQRKYRSGETQPPSTQIVNNTLSYQSVISVVVIITYVNMLVTQHNQKVKVKLKSFTNY
jgi:hypothetical protein